MTNLTPEEAPLPDDLTERFTELMRRIQAENAELDLRAEETAEADAASEAERAASARSGELGPDWAAVQRRMDLNQTSLEAVFSGEDTSTEAARLRDLSQRNLASLREQWEAEADDDEAEKEPSPSEVLGALSAESRERHQAAAERIAAILAESGLDTFKEQS
jgi:hypothetical protein